MHHMIVCRSQTDAMNIVRLLTSVGITAISARPPRDMHLRSCAWGVKIAEKDVRQTTAVLEQKGFQNWKWIAQNRSDTGNLSEELREE